MQDNIFDIGDTVLHFCTTKHIKSLISRKEYDNHRNRYFYKILGDKTWYILDKYYANSIKSTRMVLTEKNKF